MNTVCPRCKAPLTKYEAKPYGKLGVCEDCHEILTKLDEALKDSLKSPARTR